MSRLLPLAALAALAAVPLLADDVATKEKKEEFTPLFNGKDLTGWVRVNNGPKTFFVKDEMIVTTGKPTGFMRTAKMYENFVLEMEWMHVPPKKDEVGNSGLFVWGDPLPAVGSPFTRGIEVQVLVNLEWKDKKSRGITASSHGDIFSIWGAKCLPDRPHPLKWERCIPSEMRAKGANEWNHYRVEANDGVIKLAVNGKVVSGVSKASPRKGYLALEAEGSECRFRNLKIRELPSTNPKLKETCDEGKDFVPLFSGLDLSGWKAGEQKDNWKANSGANVLAYDGKAKDGGVLKTEKEYEDLELVADFRLPKGGKASLNLGGEYGQVIDLAKGSKEGAWNRIALTVKGGVVSAKLNGAPMAESRYKEAKAPLVLKAATAAEFCNLFARELK